MPEDRQPIRLLVVGLSVDVANQLVSLLRNAGYGTRPHHADELEAAVELLDQETIDLIFHSGDQNLSQLQQLAEQIAGLSKDIPCIALCKGHEAEVFKVALKNSASAVADIDDNDLIQHAVTTQLDLLKARRQVRNARLRLEEADRRCQSLLESSKDAIAYIHEGLHIYANPAYLDLFGYTNFEDIEVLSILDMAAPGEANQLKEIFEKCQSR